MLPGTPQRATHDSKRHGTSSLYAALDISTGKVIGSLHTRDRAIEFKKFLQTIDREVPADLDVHVILDNASTHKTPAIKTWLLAHARFVVHFTPTSSSWLNLVERCFGELTTKKLQRGAHRSVRQLNTDIHAWINTCNGNPKPYVWTKTADQILESIATYCNRINPITTLVDRPLRERSGMARRVPLGARRSGLLDDYCFARGRGRSYPTYALGVVSASSSVPPDPSELTRLRERFAWLANTDVDDPPSLWAAVLLRMRDDGLIRGHGSVPGELAETLVAHWYGGALQPQSTADVDVVTPGARRVQVKALRYSNPGRSSISSSGRAISFDELAVVRFEYDMRVRDALLLDAGHLRVRRPATTP